MKQTKRLLSVGLGLLLLLLTACQSFAVSNKAGPQAVAASEIEPGEAVLEDLDSLEKLQERFNQDAGKTRLVLLLSPT